MTTSTDRNSDESLRPNYVKVRDWLIDFIAEQKLGPGDKLPSERLLANALGLSRPTVARAVSELVEEGVLIREERIGTYIGSYTSRKIVTRVSTIGIVMPWLNQDSSGVVTGYIEAKRLGVPFRREGMSFQVMQGVISALKEADCKLIVHSNTSLSEEAEVLRNLTNEGLDGAVVMPSDTPDNAKLYDDIANSGLPIVLVDHYFPNCRTDRVVTDNLTGAKDCVNYLISQEHSRIAYFTDFEELTSTMERELGYRVALEEAGIPYDDEIVCGPQLIHHRQWSFQYALEHCISLPDPVTAIFCLNDDALLATLQAANKLGIHVPGDLTIAGFFDDTIPVGMQIPFIRVVQAKAKMGQIAVKLLMERIAGEAPPEPRHIQVPAKVIPASVDW